MESIIDDIKVTPIPGIPEGFVMMISECPPEFYDSEIDVMGLKIRVLNLTKAMEANKASLIKATPEERI